MRTRNNILFAPFFNRTKAIIERAAGSIASAIPQWKAIDLSGNTFQQKLELPEAKVVPVKQGSQFRLA